MARSAVARAAARIVRGARGQSGEKGAVDGRPSACADDSRAARRVRAPLAGASSRPRGRPRHELRAAARRRDVGGRRPAAQGHPRRRPGGAVGTELLPLGGGLVCAALHRRGRRAAQHPLPQPRGVGLPGSGRGPVAACRRPLPRLRAPADARRRGGRRRRPARAGGRPHRSGRAAVRRPAGAVLGRPARGWPDRTVAGATRAHGRRAFRRPVGRHLHFRDDGPFEGRLPHPWRPFGTLRPLR